MASCPFTLCTANVVPVIEQVRPDDDELIRGRVPEHRLEGPYARFGLCPASLMGLPIDEYERGILITQRALLKRLVREAERAARRDESGSRPTEPPREPQRPDDRWFRHSGGGDPRVIGPTGYRRLQRPPMGVVGPRSDESTNPPPITSQGRGEMSDNMREQYRALTNTAIEGFAQGQEICSGLTGAAEALDSQIEALRIKQETAHNLAVAAVGEGATGAPESALNMIGSSAAAGSTIDDISAALQLLLMRVAAVHASFGAAAESGRQYLATI